MSYTIFNKESFDFMKQPMFMGQPVNVARYDMFAHKKFDQLTQKQLGFFWRPQEINISKDAAQFASLPDHEQHIFTSNLKYQTLLDSIQGRAPHAILLPLVSDTGLETWITTWGFSETIHSQSYTHILRNVFTNPSIVLDSIMGTPEILARADQISHYYDELYQVSHSKTATEYEKAKALYLCLMSINALEAVRFYVSFACSFAFAERGLMIGNSNIIKLIARDEALHLSGTQYILRQMQDGNDTELMQKVAQDCEEESVKIFCEAVEQEIDWAAYLFKDGAMIGLNFKILRDYIHYIADQRMRSVGLPSKYPTRKNPLPWMNQYLDSNGVQSTPQETELTSYLTSALDGNMSVSDFEEFSDLSL